MSYFDAVQESRERYSFSFLVRESALFVDLADSKQLNGKHVM